MILEWCSAPRLLTGRLGGLYRHAYVAGAASRLAGRLEATPRTIGEPS